MKKQLKKVKKLTLGKETLIRLQHVTGGMVAGDVKAATEPPSGYPEHCYFSDCNPCDTVLQCSAA
ncbi:MAG TPA: hypothetical protein VGG20_06575 [Thermoanaerobaculia bacterium]|jgi:hypothetical protein